MVSDMSHGKRDADKKKERDKERQRQLYRRKRFPFIDKASKTFLPAPDPEPVYLRATKAQTPCKRCNKRNALDVGGSSRRRGYCEPCSIVVVGPYPRRYAQTVQDPALETLFERDAWERDQGAVNAQTVLRSTAYRRYGLTPLVIEEIKRAQRYVCALCATSPDGTGKEWRVDWNVGVGVRGLVCHSCLSQIWAARARPEWRDNRREIWVAARNYLAQRTTYDARDHRVPRPSLDSILGNRKGGLT